MSKAVLGVGTAAFIAGYGLGADIPKKDQAADLLREAIAAGIRYVDTAAGYGEAEAIIGSIAGEIVDHRVRVCTKVNGADATPDRLLTEVRTSLTRLRLDVVDTLLLHSANAGALSEPVLGHFLDEVRSTGLARRTGASTYGVADARRALAQPWCTALQVEHSILNASVVSALSANHRGAEIVVRSVLCKGLLTPRRRHAAQIARELAPTLDALDRVAAEWGWPLSELAIRFALDTPGVDAVIVGVSTQAELRAALSAVARPPLTEEAFAALRRFERSNLDAAHPERWALVELDRT